MPFPADEAFAIVEAASRELPNVESVEVARDSLQVHARVPRRYPYLGDKAGKPRAARRRATATIPRGTRWRWGGASARRRSR